MPYSSSLLKDKVTVIQPSLVNGKTAWYEFKTIHAGVTFVKGARALMMGDITAYQTIMVRCRWTTGLHERCRLICGGKYYVIDSMNASMRENTMQMTCIQVDPFDYVTLEQQEEEQAKQATGDNASSN